MSFCLKETKNYTWAYWAIIQKYYHEVQVLGTENPLEICVETGCVFLLYHD